jgi:hypothetical protein
MRGSDLLRKEREAKLAQYGFQGQDSCGYDLIGNRERSVKLKRGTIYREQGTPGETLLKERTKRKGDIILDSYRGQTILREEIHGVVDKEVVRAASRADA